MKYKHVILKLDGKVATITLNRPDKLNAINDEMLRDLLKALDKVKRDFESKVVVIKGAGKSFCAGQDLSGEGTNQVMPPDPREKAYLYDMFTMSMQAEPERMAIYLRIPQDYDSTGAWSLSGNGSRSCDGLPRCHLHRGRSVRRPLCSHGNRLAQPLVDLPHRIKEN